MHKEIRQGSLAWMAPIEQHMNKLTGMYDRTTVSFAIYFGEGPIVKPARLWIDDVEKLPHCIDANFRYYNGMPGQGYDHLLGGIPTSSSWIRGVYIVFENFDITDTGRIPSVRAEFESPYVRQEIPALVVREDGVRALLMMEEGTVHHYKLSVPWDRTTAKYSHTEKPTPQHAVVHKQKTEDVYICPATGAELPSFNDAVRRTLYSYAVDHHGDKREANDNVNFLLRPKYTEKLAVLLTQIVEHRKEAP